MTSAETLTYMLYFESQSRWSMGLSSAERRLRSYY